MLKELFAVLQATPERSLRQIESTFNRKVFYIKYLILINVGSLDCPLGWKNVSSQYFRAFASPIAVNVTKAKLKCAESNAALVLVHSPEENQWIANETKADTVLNGRFVRNTAWVWLDQSGWGYSKWGKGEPDRESACW